jgi:hypothetical protein
LSGLQQAGTLCRIDPRSGILNAASGLSGAPTGNRGRTLDAAARWVAVLMAATLLAACEHGSMSYNRSTGTFNMPFGQGSNR